VYKRQIEDLPLFRAAPAPAPAPAPRAPAVELRLRAADPDALSPREALEALYRLRGLLGPG
ncbi:MAG: hypothetical protein N3D71_14495, partial [Burkholderiaceae bacterium]|nr:hypothetical protein [Burkholderiaceae bacterium]